MRFNKKAQGAMEYLLIIGAAILVVAVVIIAISGIMVEGKESVDGEEVNAVGNPLKDSLADSRGQYFLPANTERNYIYIGDQTSVDDFLNTLEDKDQIEKVCVNDYGDLLCGSSTIISFNNLLVIKSKSNTTLPKSSVIDITKPSNELEWSEDFAPYGFDLFTICQTKYGAGWRLPTPDELSSAMARYFIQNQPSPTFQNNVDYWSLSLSCADGEGWLMWWNMGTTRGGMCYNYVELSHPSRLVKCVKD